MIRARSAGGMPDAGVGDRHLDAAVGRAARDREPPALRHGVAGVADQVAEDDPELVGVGQGRRAAPPGRSTATCDASPGGLVSSASRTQRLDRDRAQVWAPASWRSSTAP